MEREEAIKKLVAEQAIEDQATLVRLLHEKWGIETSQVQVSRDLKKLGIGKKKSGDKMIYDYGDKTVELLRLAVKEVVHNESLVIVKTYPGLADFLGDYIDNDKNGEILATLGGENVVFITPITTTRIKETYELVCKILHYRSPA